MRAIATRMEHGHRGMTLTRTKEKNLLTIKVEWSPLEIWGDSKCVVSAGVSRSLSPLHVPWSAGEKRKGRGCDQNETGGEGGREGG